MEALFSRRPSLNKTGNHMAIQQSTVTRNRFRDAFSSAFPATATLDLRSGAQAGVGGAATGTLLATITLPASPYTAGVGQLTKNGTWSNTAAAAGTIGHYRLTSGTDIEEGSVTATGGGGDLTVDTITVSAIGQTITVNTFTFTVPGA